MLISVFGLWLMAANVAMLEQDGDDCEIYFISGAGYGKSHIYHEFEDMSCDEVALEINRKVKWLEDE